MVFWFEPLVPQNVGAKQGIFFVGLIFWDRKYWTVKHTDQREDPAYDMEQKRQSGQVRATVVRASQGAPPGGSWVGPLGGAWGRETPAGWLLAALEQHSSRSTMQQTPVLVFFSERWESPLIIPVPNHVPSHAVYGYGNNTSKDQGNN